MSISGTIKSIQDIMRKDAGVDGDAQRISQLVWMIFLKVFDDAEAASEMLDDTYKSPVPTRLRWRTWAKDPEGITGEPLLDFINGDLFKTLKDLPVTGKNPALSAVVRSVFEDAFNYMKSGQLLRQVVNKLNEIDFNKATDRHQFGDIYETILADLQNAGNAGEYYTPRAVTQFIVDQLDPQLGETFFDPACGTGGFLTSAIEHVRKKYVKSAKDEAKLQGSILGVEKKQLPHLLCVTNMLFHGIEVPSNIRRDNTLARPLRDYKPKDRVDVIGSKVVLDGRELSQRKALLRVGGQTDHQSRVHQHDATPGLPHAATTARGAAPHLSHRGASARPVRPARSKTTCARRHCHAARGSLGGVGGRFDGMTPGAAQ